MLRSIKTIAAVAALAGALAELLGPYGFRNESVAELVKEAV